MNPYRFTPYRFVPGEAPLLMSIPHVGTAIPAAVEARMTERALMRPDTDWHLDRLYDFANELGIPTLQAVWSRYVADLNRPPDDAPLYPGRLSTGLIPEHDFAGNPLYLPKAKRPDEEERVGAAEHRLAALPPAAGAGAGLDPPQARHRHPVRLPFDPVGGAAPVRRQIAGLQPGHRGGRRLRCGAEPATGRSPWRLTARTGWSSTAASRAASSRASTATRTTASTPSSSSCPWRPIATRSGALELCCRTKPPGSAPRCAPCWRRPSTWARERG